MTPEEYDSWYDSARGRWIGETEYRLILQLLKYTPGEKILDVGCGTGWFTRRIARLLQSEVTGIDIDPASLVFARTKDSKTTYSLGDARCLPFEDDSFHRVVSITALCFVADWPLALREIVRVTRHRFVIGLLNRYSLLWRNKGRGEDQGAYQGAHWHDRREVMASLADLPVTNIQVRTDIWLPDGSLTARTIERCLSNRFPFGSFLLIAGDKTRSNKEATSH